MNRKLLTLAVLGACLALPHGAMAEDAAAPAAAEPASPHSFAYNIGLFSQYIFRGLTQTGEKLALQGGVDYTHASGFYVGAWASNISWLEDAGAYENSSLELDVYGGYRGEFGKSGVGYDIGLLQYIYPGDKNPGIKRAETTEIYGALSWKWLQGKLSYVASDGAWGFDDADGTWYAELNANIPIGESGFTVVAHVGRQDFDGRGNDVFDYTDWKLGLTKSFSNGVNVGAYYTDTNAREAAWTDASGQYLGDNQFTVFVQKTF
ncbi:MAG: TorF family putative porin [Methylophilaceae bacterium]|nr:TorF family putative porin [Methylophilaceae bacterium]